MKHRKFFQIIVIIIFVLIFAVPSVIYWCKGKAFQKSVSLEKKQISELYERKFRDGAFKKLSVWLEP